MNDICEFPPELFSDPDILGIGVATSLLVQSSVASIGIIVLAFLIIVKKYRTQRKSGPAKSNDLASRRFVTAETLAIALDEFQ